MGLILVGRLEPNLESPVSIYMNSVQKEVGNQIKTKLTLEPRNCDKLAVTPFAE